MFNKVLIANRGEIAVRVIRGCQELNIKTVAVYSDADKNARFVTTADEAYPIGPSSAKLSYLKGDKIIEVALKAGADAIHPGYGFLAENKEFAEACKKAKITYVGPTPEAIYGMGDKIHAKKTMTVAGVPVVHGSKGEVTGLDQALGIAEEIGYPIIVKATAGGGGRGMKIVYRAEELENAIDTAKKMAASSFGNPIIFIEKYLENPRHIEFQILGDNNGNIYHLCERECSIQRGHQKLIEESPSPIMTPELRARMGADAIAAAEAVDYTNAGTVEFLYDVKTGKYYFLEMNTRLQVEHPVTEEAIRAGGQRIDLVKDQLRIASGENLKYKQEEILPANWAIECRINAEDPLKFKPSMGVLKKYRSSGGPGVRIDSGVHTGYEISPFYDSMVSKLIVFDNTRDEAIARMRRALRDYVVVGVDTNIPFHKAVMNNEYFIRGEMTTSFIKEHGEQIFAEVKRIMDAEMANGNKYANGVGVDGDLHDHGDKKATAAEVAVALRTGYQLGKQGKPLPTKWNISVTKAPK